MGSTVVQRTGTGRPAGDRRDSPRVLVTRLPAPADPAAGAGSPAEVELPVASVVLDVPLAHLDRPFDYLVPPEMSVAAQPGVRVRVRFAGKAVAGYVVQRRVGSEHPGRLSPLAAVVSPEPVLAPDLLTVARHVADRCAGTLADVLRLAVPPRHARVEAELPPAPVATGVASDPERAADRPRAAGGPVPATPWERYAGGAALLRRLADAQAPRAAVAALPGDGPALVAAAVAATVSSGRGALVVVPDARDVAAFAAAATAVLGPGSVTELTAGLGPAPRYRAWLAVRRGSARVVVGTRAAAFAPVADLGLTVCWDDGDDLLAEPRAPYPHARDVLVRRSVDQDAALLLAGHVVSPEAAALARDGFLAVLAPDRPTTRAVVPRVVAAGADSELARDPAARAARIPALVLRTVRAALADGPVLVQVPRAGYLPVLACQECRHPATCEHCSGPLSVPGSGGVATCRWCGRPAARWRCPECGSTRFRSRRVGSARTAEELGRALPGVAVVQSAAGAADGVRATVPDRPALVVATPGAEPVAAGGYAAAVLLDGDTLLARPELAAGQEALRRWVNAAALVRTAGPDTPAGSVVVVADAGQRVVQALVRWDPVGAAEAELDDRVATALPPATVVVELVGAPADVADLLARAELPATALVLGPVPLPPGAGGGPGGGSAASGMGAPAGEADRQVRALVRDRRGRGAALTRALGAAQAARTARKQPHVRLRVDPVDLG